MSMYIWLNHEAERSIKAHEEGKFSKERVGRLENMEVYADNDSGEKHLIVYGDIFDPTKIMPDVPEKFVKKVTLKERIDQGFRAEGIYRIEGATLLIRSKVRVHFRGDNIAREEWQEISVSAPNIEMLKAIYTLVRQGDLDPEENWGGDTPLTPPSEAGEDESGTATD